MCNGGKGATVTKEQSVVEGWYGMMRPCRMQALASSNQDAESGTRLSGGVFDEYRLEREAQTLSARREARGESTSDGRLSNGGLLVGRAVCSTIVT